MHSLEFIPPLKETGGRNRVPANPPLRSATFFALGLLIGLLVLAVAGCSKNSVLVGKWQGDESSDIAEFHADGTFTMGGDKDMKGTFSFNGETLELKLDGDVGKMIGKISARVKVEGDVMKITDPDNGKVETMKRVK